MNNPFLHELRLIDRLLFTSIKDIPTAFADITPEQSIAELGFDIHEVVTAYQQQKCYTLSNYAFSTEPPLIGDTDKAAVILTQWLNEGMHFAWSFGNTRTRITGRALSAKDDANQGRYQLVYRLLLRLEHPDCQLRFREFLRRFSGYDEVKTADLRTPWFHWYHLKLQAVVNEELPPNLQTEDALPNIAERVRTTTDPTKSIRDNVTAALRLSADFIWHIPSWKVYLEAIYQTIPSTDQPAYTELFLTLANIHKTGLTTHMADLSAPCLDYNICLFLFPRIALWLLNYYPLNFIELYSERSYRSDLITKLEISSGAFTPQLLAALPDTVIMNLCRDSKDYEAFTRPLTKSDHRRDIRPSWLVKTLIKAYQEAEEIATDAEALPGIWGLRMLHHIKSECGILGTPPPDTDIQL